MAIPADHLSTHLTLMEGGRSITQRRDEAHIEAIAFCDEVIAAAAAIVNSITGLPVPSISAMDAAMKLAYRADFAKAELLALTTPLDAA